MWFSLVFCCHCHCHCDCSGHCVTLSFVLYFSFFSTFIMSTTLNITTLLTPKIVFSVGSGTPSNVLCHCGLFYAIVFSCLMREYYMCDIVRRRIDWNSNYCCWLFAEYEARDNDHNFYIDNGNNINQKLHQMKCWSLAKLDRYV